jgi:hypothetical protein
MNVTTGDLKTLKPGEEPPKGSIEISSQELMALKNVPDGAKPQELALLRFKSSRRFLRDQPVTLQEANAFRLGFQACQALLAIGREQ